MSKVSDISSKLLALSEEQGYLLFDDIITYMKVYYTIEVQ